MRETLDAIAVAQLHDALVDWLTREHPQAPALVVMSALSYEIARLVATLDRGRLTSRAIDGLLDDVRSTMRLQIDAHRRGHL